MIGGWLNGYLGKKFTVIVDGAETLDYSRFWYTLAVIGLVTTIIFLVGFRDETGGGADAAGDATD